MKINKVKTKLKELRLEKGATQKDVANYLNFVESGYASYEQGRTEPSLDILIKLAKFFDVTTDYLLGLED